MKRFFVTALAILASAAACIGQTRNVLVDSNSRIVSPTNFWSVNASNASTTLGLGTAATNPSSAFQASSTNLTLLSSNNAVNLTNIQASGVSGQFTNFSATSISVASTAYINYVVFSNPVSVRTNIGLGWAALTNTSAGQFSADTGLAFSNGIVANVSGVVAITNGGTGATNAANARTNIGVRWDGITNTLAGAVQKDLFTTNKSIYEEFVFGGSTNYSEVIEWTNSVIKLHYPIKWTTTIGATHEAVTRTNLGIPWTGLTNTNAANMLAALGGASPSGAVALATNAITASNFVGGVIAITNGGTGSTNVDTARTNLGLGYGITTNVSFVDISTNTNSVTISNGIITDWSINP